MSICRPRRCACCRIPANATSRSRTPRPPLRAEPEVAPAPVSRAGVLPNSPPRPQELWTHPGWRPSVLQSRENRHALRAAETHVMLTLRQHAEQATEALHKALRISTERFDAEGTATIIELAMKS